MAESPAKRSRALAGALPGAPRAAIFLLGIGAIAVAIYRGGLFFCPTARYFHFPCPACGSTRAVHAMLDLDLDEMLRTNPIAPVVVIVVGAIILRAAWLMWKEGSARNVGEGKRGAMLVRALGWCFALEMLVWAGRMFGLFGGPVNV